MKERPIIFNGDMVRAILDGRKTQTRRALTERHLNLLHVASRAGECYPLESGIDHDNSQSYYREYCPFGKPGDRLWVRETHHVGSDGYTYRADGDWIENMRKTGAFGCDDKWIPSIHMKRTASRILLEITNVGVQRLNSISHNDAAREGLAMLPASGRYCINPGDQYFGGASHDANEVFSWLWSSIYGEESWNANPWVWVIEFKRVGGSDASK